MLIVGSQLLILLCRPLCMPLRPLLLALEDEAAVRVMHVDWNTLERDSAPECIWTSIYTIEYNRVHDIRVCVSKQRECEVTVV
jgi:hypothetical protein